MAQAARFKQFEAAVLFAAIAVVVASVDRVVVLRITVLA
jgi:hypothetical protein